MVFGGTFGAYLYIFYIENRDDTRVCVYIHSKSERDGISREYKGEQNE